MNIPYGVAYRATSLKYCKWGLSPAGSRQRAGRFNRHDRSAIYLSLEPETALAEYFGSDPHRPAVVLPVQLEVTDVIDITGRLGRWPAKWRRWQDDWTAARDAIEAGLDSDCASWQCGDEVIERNCKGIIFPSMVKSGGTNIVVFPEHAVGGVECCKIQDPAGEIRAAHPVKMSNRS